MKSILEKLYAGEFYPAENILPEDPAYRGMCETVGKERHYFADKLSDGDRERFEQWNDLVSDTQAMDDYANFAYGFRTGMLLMYETFSGGEIPDVVKPLLEE